MNAKLLLTGGALCCLHIAAPATADEPSRYSSGAGHSDYAEVIRVEPITRTVRVSTPRRECREEQVTRHYHGYAGRSGSYTPHILGGLLGGVAGNQFGKGSGNVAMTAASALLGTSVGRDVARQRGASYHSVPAVETRCHVVHESHYEEQTDGYRVEYRYGDRTYVSRMTHHPGDRLPVKVHVTPVH